MKRETHRCEKHSRAHCRSEDHSGIIRQLCSFQVIQAPEKAAPCMRFMVLAHRKSKILFAIKTQSCREDSDEAGAAAARLTRFAVCSRSLKQEQESDLSAAISGTRANLPDHYVYSAYRRAYQSFPSRLTSCLSVESTLGSTSGLLVATKLLLLWLSRLRGEGVPPVW